jgi:hypothetical protein
MGFKVRLEDEKGKQQGRALDTTDILGRPARRDPDSLAGSRLLRFTDPYGDTVFNAPQAKDLILDIMELAAATSDEDA